MYLCISYVNVLEQNFSTFIKIIWNNLLAHIKKGSAD